MGARGVRRLVAVVLAGVVLAAACGGSGADQVETTRSDGGHRGQLPRLHAVRGERPGVFDEHGRQVVLRGVNVNGLAAYARNNPALDPTIPITHGTWDRIAAEGFNVVRLQVSWSRVEPERGEYDEDYVMAVRAAVRAAARRGLYTVIDMHQDAWGPFVATPAGVACPAGREPSNGWDGAPEWATPSPDTFDSCRPADGDAKPGSELVTEAWDRFYRDTDGIQTAFVEMWEHLVAALGGHPGIAGYDILNEPGHGRGDMAPSGLLADFAPLGQLYDRAIEAIRAGEDRASTPARPIFFEHTVSGNPPPAGFSDDPGLVFAPHVYGGSIIDFITVDQNWDLVLGGYARWGTSIWVGEYGWWSDPASQPELVGRVERFAVREDGGPGPGAGTVRAPFVPVGSAWWQWNNGCGDPHQITDRGAPAPVEIRQYRVTRCVDGAPVDAGVVPGWRTILTRPAVRFAPGWITDLTSDGDPAGLTMQAVEATPGTWLELWAPGEQRPVVAGSGIAQIDARRLGRGWRITARVCTASYIVSLGRLSSSSADDMPHRCRR
jgi:endoglycosylceramidase